MTNYCMIDYYMGVFFNAESVNTDEVVKMYKKHLKRCKKDYMSLTDLVIAINRMNWHWYREKNYELADFYGDLFYLARETVYEIVKDNDEARSYLFSQID